MTPKQLKPPTMTDVERYGYLAADAVQINYHQFTRSRLGQVAWVLGRILAVMVRLTIMMFKVFVVVIFVMFYMFFAFALGRGVMWKNLPK